MRIAASDVNLNAITGLIEEPAGVLVNANNKGYCRAIFDAKSKQFFIKYLSLITNDVNRGNVWRILCDNMKIKLLSGETMIKCVIDHIGPEDEEFTMPVVLATVQWILKYKLDASEQSKQLKADLYTSLFNKLSHCKTASMEVLILSVMIPLLNSKNAAQAIKWVQDKFIGLENGKQVNLKKPQRYQLLKIIFASIEISSEGKFELLINEKLIDFSDFDVLEELGCLASLPDQQ